MTLSSIYRKVGYGEVLLWNTSRKKMQAVGNLKRRGYKSLPLRRVYIPKRNGSKRALHIPCMQDRAMQTLYLLALEPVAEQNADPNSYGFRKARSIQDAHEQCFNVLAPRRSATWILDADIDACFDKIDHSWLIEHIPMDKRMLSQWLKVGYFDGNMFHPTQEGTPQGGSVSPSLANMTLDGLEESVRSAVPRRRKGELNPKVNFIRYADDLMVTASSREILEEIVTPAIAAFLEQRGLHLSKEKTRIVHIEEGFDFLGAHVRKYNGRLLIRPQKANVKGLIRKVREFLQRNRGAKTEALIHQLNPILRGWAYQFRHLVASKTFQYIDHCIFRQLWRWARRRHTNKSASWVKNRYFTTQGNHRWVFSTRQVRADGKSQTIVLFRMSSLQIRRHTKIRSEARFHDPKYTGYFKQRQQRRNRKGNEDVRQDQGFRQLELDFEHF